MCHSVFALEPAENCIHDKYIADAMQRLLLTFSPYRATNTRYKQSMDYACEDITALVRSIVI